MPCQNSSIHQMLQTGNIRGDNLISFAQESTEMVPIKCIDSEIWHSLHQEMLNREQKLGTGNCSSNLLRGTLEIKISLFLVLKKDNSLEHWSLYPAETGNASSKYISLVFGVMCLQR